MRKSASRRRSSCWPGASFRDCRRASKSAASRFICRKIATPGNRGFYVAWQSGSQQIAVIVAALIGLVMSRSFAPDQISGWGWRVPFLIGSALIPFLFVIRRLLAETPESAQGGRA